MLCRLPNGQDESCCGHSPTTTIFDLFFTHGFRKSNIIEYIKLLTSKFVG